MIPHSSSILKVKTMWDNAWETFSNSNYPLSTGTQDLQLFPFSQLLYVSPSQLTNSLADVHNFVYSVSSMWVTVSLCFFPYRGLNPGSPHWATYPVLFLLRQVFDKLSRLGLKLWSCCFSLPECWGHRHVAVSCRHFLWWYGCDKNGKQRYHLKFFLSSKKFVKT